MHLVRLLVIIAIGCALMSCAGQTTMIGDLRVSGVVSEISVGDVHAAIAADRAVTKERIFAVEVVSRDEMRIYHEPMFVPHANQDIVKRVRGKWRFIGTPVTLG
jgi:Zn-dependent alcohol dehydrogenase